MSDKQTPENAVDYKATLNLPDTEFAMKANLAVREAKWLEEWYADNIYQQIRESRIGKKKYVLHDGPPYANGQIHLGHAVNKVLKDIHILERGYRHDVSKLNIGIIKEITDSISIVMKLVTLGKSLFSGD